MAEGAAPRLRVRRVTGAPVVAVRVWVAGGARREGPPGAALIAGRLLSEGTAERSWSEIAAAIEARGFALSSFGSYELHGLSLDGLAADWEWALDQAADLIYRASFPEDRCRWLTRQAAAELDSLADQPQVKTSWGFSEQLYRPHRRRLPVQGTSADLAALTAQQCAEFHRATLAAAPLVITVAGEIDESAVQSRLEQLFPPARGEGGALDSTPAPDGSAAARREVRFEAAGSGEQAHLFLGHLTVPRHHDDFDALDLLSVVLGSGSGLTGRIPDRIREQEGLAYTASAHAALGAGIDAGRLTAYVGTSVATVEQAERGVREELEKVLADGIRDDELESARSYLLGRLPFARETARQWADLLATAVLYDLPLDRPGWREQRLEGLDRGAVEAAARRHLDPQALRVTVGLPAG
ncbi:MAG: pitrilysin family protein [Acidobacteriota bacterium]